MTSKLTQLLESRHRPRILVVGDVMLDRYVWGDVDRISYEAPIPVLRMDQREERLGGAGSVVAILAALEADVLLASVVGDDPEGRTVRDLLEALNVPSNATLTAADRPTTVKERLLGRTQSRHPQQMLRVDHEGTSPIQPLCGEALLQSIRGSLGAVDLVLISDYGKGVCAGELVRQVATAARQFNIPIIADPARGVDYARYCGCTAVTPNRFEAGLAAGRKIVLPQDGIEAARRLLEFGLQAAVVTLDRDGIAWADVQGRAELCPVEQREVYDVTGAGDAVLSALGFSIACGGDWPEAIRLANLAGGLMVQRLGVVPFRREELLAELSRGREPGNPRIVSVEQLEMRLGEHRRRGQRIVMTNGCFDLLHPGHIAALQYARRQGDCLVVGLNSDRSVALLKGSGRPLVDEQGRAEMLAALACVDYVVVFDDTSVEGLVKRVLPDVLVKSEEYTREQVVGHRIVDQQGGQVALGPMKGNYSTRGLIARIQGMAQ